MPMTWTKVKPPWNCSRFGTSPRRFVTSSPRFGTSPQPCRKGVKMIGGENAQGQSPKEFSTFCCSELGPRVSLVWIQVTSLILTCCLVEMEYGWKFREFQGSQNPFSSTFLVFVFLKMHKAKLYYHMVLPICSRWIQTPIYIYIYIYIYILYIFTHRDDFQHIITPSWYKWLAQGPISLQSFQSVPPSDALHLPRGSTLRRWTRRCAQRCRRSMAVSPGWWRGLNRCGRSHGRPATSS